MGSTSLYEQIKERFQILYKGIHESHEPGFSASLEPGGAGLLLEVDFYGRGRNPPHALHSEGHQDSMGVCLFLALTEFLTQGVIDLVMLDDVVMSVDTEHRRHLAKLLAKEFSHRQLLITSHDKTWVNQLKAEGVITSQDLLEFYNWEVALGPQVIKKEDWWKSVYDDLESGSVSRAAGALRRGLEEFFETACDALYATVRYRSDGRWGLGDFAPAAISQLKKLVRKTKSASNSWGDLETVQKLNEFEGTFEQICERTRLEEWALNANVHYNNWTNFSGDDLTPVVEAFQDLCLAFQCPNCTGILKVAGIDNKQVSVRCICTQIDWNLVQKNGVSHSLN